MSMPKSQERPLALFDSSSNVGEEFRLLRTNIQYNQNGPSLKTMLITSAGLEEGKSLITANLAFVFAKAGTRVLAVDANLRRPALSYLFGKDPPGGGLTGVLSGSEPIDRAVLKGPWPGLALLPAGPLPSNPTELLGSRSMQDFLAAAQRAYDLILMDMPPVLGFADAVIVAPRTDGTILVVRSGFTTTPQAKRARDALMDVGARILGVVLDGVKPGCAGA